MTDKEFIKTVTDYIENGNFHIQQEREILLTFKNAGGKQETAKKLLEELASQLPDNGPKQDIVYDILDIVTGWCSGDVRVWK